MKKLLAIALVCGAFLLGACSTHSQSMLSGNLTQTQVVLSQDNFKVVGYAEGESTVTRILGIGGCSHKAVRDVAVSNMFKNANLKGSQTIININFKKSQAGFSPFYTEQTWVATGVIVEFTE
ncbi:MAG: hypothetical protein J6Q20_03500 [Alistipes sp.]|jgi:hypothetical protein|nr:hypothetical protein [Alistipes sp.]